MDKQPVLSICIPIYNRIEFLRRHFEQFIKNKELFSEKIHLYVSDNCSKDDLQSLVKEYSSKGLNIEYSRNSENIGPDGNFIKCFNSAKGKYIWLLGSDDIPVDGFIERLVDILEKNEYGYVFLDNYRDDKKVIEYNDAGEILQRINVWITFMSANIFKTEFVKNVRGEDYMGTYLIQVPYFLEGIVAGQTNAVINYSWIQEGSDYANNGGYNYFQVFCANLLNIVKDFVLSKRLPKRVYHSFKKSLYIKHLVRFLYVFTIRKRAGNNMDISHAWSIVAKFYWYNLYFYLFPFIILTILIRGKLRIVLQKYKKYSYK